MRVSLLLVTAVTLSLACGHDAAPDVESAPTDGSEHQHGDEQTNPISAEVSAARSACASTYQCLLDRCMELAQHETALVSEGCPGGEGTCADAAAETTACLEACGESILETDVCAGDDRSFVCESLRSTAEQPFMACDVGRGARCEFVTVSCEEWAPPPDPGC